MKPPAEIVMSDSPEAARLVTVTGWVSRDGRFYGDDERTARYAGCTHRPCDDCGAPTEKLYLACRACREKRDLARFLARPRKAWDGEAMIYSDARDRYYSSPDDAEEELEEGETLGGNA